MSRESCAKSRKPKAVTCESLVDSDTAEQLKVFSKYAKENGNLLQIAVLANCGNETGEQIVNRRIRELGMSVDYVWWPNRSQASA